MFADFRQQKPRDIRYNLYLDDHDDTIDPSTIEAINGDVFTIAECLGFGQISLFMDTRDDDIRDILQDLCEMVACAPFGEALLDIAANAGYSLSLDVLDFEGCDFDRATKTVTLDTFGMAMVSLNSTSKTALEYQHKILIHLIRALREISHDVRLDECEIKTSRHFSPFDTLRFNRACAADIEVVTMLTLWQLRHLDDDEDFEFIERSKRATLGVPWRIYMGGEHSDIAATYMNLADHRAASLGGALYDMKALRTAFLQWFEDSNRVNECDHNALDALDAGDLLESSEDRGTQKLTSSFLSYILSASDATSYAGEITAIILREPRYAACTDPINQAYLTQIIDDQARMADKDMGGIVFQDKNLANKLFPHCARLL